MQGVDISFHRNTLLVSGKGGCYCEEKEKDHRGGEESHNKQACAARNGNGGGPEGEDGEDDPKFEKGSGECHVK